MQQLLNHINFWMLLRVTLTVIVGLPLIWFLENFLKKWLVKHISLHIAVLLSNVAFYIGVIVFVISILNDLGFSVTALVGAAGVVGVAISFAARTSFSNIISGIFLIMEQPFIIGDYIFFDNLSGTVKSIDLFSIKIKTADGILVRIPNESLIQKPIKNYMFYNYLRMNFKLQVLPSVSLEECFTLVQEVIKKNAVIKKEPAPFIAIDAVSTDSIDFLVQVWAKNNELTKAYKELADAFAAASKEHNIYIALSNK